MFEKLPFEQLNDINFNILSLLLLLKTTEFKSNELKFNTKLPFNSTHPSTDMIVDELLPPPFNPFIWRVEDDENDKLPPIWVNVEELVMRMELPINSTLFVTFTLASITNVLPDGIETFPMMVVFELIVINDAENQGKC